MNAGGAGPPPPCLDLSRFSTFLHLMKEIKKLLVANRSEIAIRVFRTAHELGIRTVAIYSHKDRYALHRFKAEEAYLIGNPDEPIRAYLDIEWIVSLARENQVDAIHPGYGFLSENPDFARACEREGIIFIGPQVEVLERLGDKTSARKIAADAGVPVLGGSEEAIADVAEGEQQVENVGYPIILKAARGGGGRGMRVVRGRREFPDAFEDAQRESLTAFGSADVFIERFVQKARHIEVQLLGDKHGNLVHLSERDCSVQRRHQKLVEIAPALDLDEKVRRSLHDAAVAIGREVGYQSAGTVEFLVDQDEGNFYFIEVNPRIQVEHTVTEEVTGVDLIKAQILVAQGTPLDDEEIGLSSQVDVRTQGFCHAVPRDHRRSHERLHARLRACVALPLGGGHGGAARRRQRVLRCGREPVLRLPAGEGDDPGDALHRRGPAHGAVPPGVPYSWRENEYSVPDSPGDERAVLGGWLHDTLHRSDARACSSYPSGATVQRDF